MLVNVLLKNEMAPEKFLPTLLGCDLTVVAG